MDIISIILLAVFGLFALIGAIHGFKQGASREIIRVVTAAISAVIAVFIAKPCYTKVAAFFDGMTIEQIHDWIKGLKIIPTTVDISWILNFDPATIKNIIVIPLVLIVIPLIFVLSFVVINAVMKVIHIILCGVLGLSKKRKNAVTSMLGLIIGLVQGVAIAGIICLPVIGLGNAATLAVAEVNEKMPSSEAAKNLNTLYDGYVKPISENPVIDFIGKCGFDALYTSLVTVEDDGKSVDMTEMLNDAAMIYAHSTGFKKFNWQSLSAENIASLNGITDVIASNEYLTNISANMISAMAKAYAAGTIKLPISAPFDEAVDEMMHIFETTDAECVNSDIDTILAVYYILSDEQILVAYTKDSNDLLDALTEKDANGETPVNLIIDELRANDRTKPIVTVITKISISVMQENLGLTEETVEVYESVKEGLNETLQIKRDDFAEGEAGDQEYKEAVSGSIDTTLKESNIVLEPEIVDSMADYVVENFSDTEEITDEEINDIILSYYDAYLEYLENGTIPDGVPAP